MLKAFFRCLSLCGPAAALGFIWILLKVKAGYGNMIYQDFHVVPMWTIKYILEYYEAEEL